MNRLARGALIVLAPAAFAGPASSAVTLTMDFHMTASTFNCDGTVDPATASCGDIQANGPYVGGANQIFVLIGGASGGPDGVSAVQFGIDFSSTGETDLFSLWSSCRGQQVSLIGPNGEWPTSGSGVAIAFGQCIRPTNPGGIIAVGFLFGTNTVSAGEMVIIPDPIQGVVQVVNCNDATVNLALKNTGLFDFGGVAGEVQCVDHPDPIEETSWGQIKTLF